MTLATIKARYQAAFDAYQDIMKRNVERAIAGDKPSDVDLERETAALNVLAESRREFFAALAPNLAES